MEEFVSLPAEIIPEFLFLGSVGHAEDLEILERLGIKAIVNCARESRDFFPENFAYLHLDLQDSESEDLSPVITECMYFISRHRADKSPVLVHCQQGVSRSASICLAYLMIQEKMSLKQAYQHVQNCRPCISPNWGFLRFLCSLEMKTFGIEKSTLEIPKDMQTKKEHNVVFIVDILPADIDLPYEKFTELLGDMLMDHASWAEIQSHQQVFLAFGIWKTRAVIRITPHFQNNVEYKDMDGNEFSELVFEMDPEQQLISSCYPASI